MPRRLFPICLLILLSIVCLQAQVSTSSIFGTVTDATGAVMPNVEVTATNLDTNFSRNTATGPDGQYLIQFLPVGNYRVEAQAKGFKSFTQNGIAIDVATRARVDASLQVGATTENVVVEGDAPLVNTADAQLGRTVQNLELVQLPLVNRDAYNLLNLTPGVQSESVQNTVGFRGTTVFINGSGDGGAGSVAYYLDGGANMTGLRNTGNAMPNPDVIQEFRVITNGYSAEFGRFTSGVVDVVTKSGTNQMHGSLFEFLRNDKMNANSWNSLTKPSQRRNQFGGTAGGAIKKDKLFYFGSYQGLRERANSKFSGAIVPTAAELTGDFSKDAKVPKNPTGVTGAITNGVIAANAVDPVAMKILQQYASMGPNLGNAYQWLQSRPTDLNEVTGKVDYSPSEKHLITGSYFYSKGFDTPTTTGNMPWSSQNYNWLQQNFNASDTWTVSPTLINQFRLTYVRNFGGRLNLPGLDLADFGSKYVTQGPKSLPQITITGFMTFGQSIQGPVAGSNYYGLRDSFSWMHGKHSFKYGIDASLEKFIQDTSLNNYGVWSFDGSKTGNALADFMLGIPNSFKQDTPCTKIDNDWYTGVYVQDDWRIHPRFTLNIGLRYEIPTSMTDPLNRKMTWAPGVQSTVAPNAPKGLLFPGDPGISRGVIGEPRKQIAPRIGMAWDPFGDGKTSIRVSGGLFYGSISSNNMNMTTDYQPFSARQTFNNVKTLSDPYGNMATVPFPISYDPKNIQFRLLPSDVSTLATNFHFPYTYQLNFSVQRQVRSDVSVTASYVGSITHHLPFTVDKNYAGWATGATSGNLGTRRPYLPGTLGIIYYEDGIINAAYHAMQTSVEKRLSHGFMIRGFYTFAKGLEGAQTTNNQPTGGAEDFRNLSIERARTGSDRTHVFNFSAVWQFNYFKGALPLQHMLNGWSLSAIGTAQSGTPLTVTAGSDINVDGTNNDRADLVGNPVLDPNRSRSDVTNAWFNTTAFAKPATGADGNSARNLFDGPGAKWVDLGFFRQFKLREAMKLEFRAELTNALNIVNLSGPTTTLSSANFGKITSAGSMRQTQLGMRLSW
jgi:hypothetical protein